jgi:hypothetical protein
MITATKVPRQCPFVLLVKVGWREGKTFGNEENTHGKWSNDKLSRLPLHSITTPNSDIKPWEDSIG